MAVRIAESGNANATSVSGPSFKSTKICSVLVNCLLSLHEKVTKAQNVKTTYSRYVSCKCISS